VSGRLYIFDCQVDWGVPVRHRYVRIEKDEAHDWLERAVEAEEPVHSLVRDLLTCGYILNDLGRNIRSRSFRAEFLREDRAPPAPDLLGAGDEALAVWWNDGASPPGWEHGLVTRRRRGYGDTT